MAEEFFEGREVKQIFFDDDSEIAVYPYGPAKTMVVSMEPGQMGMVPWIHLTFDDGREITWNASHLAGVEFLIEKEKA